MVVDFGKSGPKGEPFLPAHGRAQPAWRSSSPGGGVLTFLAGGTVDATRRQWSPLYVMVGKRELVETGGNTADFETFWVAVNPQSGLVITAENAGRQGRDPIR